MGKLLDFVKRWKGERGRWARFGDDAECMRPTDVLQRILDPVTGAPEALVGVLSPGDGCAGYALTADEAEELGHQLLACASALREEA